MARKLDGDAAAAAAGNGGGGRGDHHAYHCCVSFGRGVQNVGFFSVVSGGHTLVVVLGFLIGVASLVVEHRL